MASAELARKLQRRRLREEAGGGAPEAPARAPPNPEPLRRGPPAPESPARGPLAPEPPVKELTVPEPPARGPRAPEPPVRRPPAPEPPVRGPPVPELPARGPPAPESPATPDSVDPELSALLSRRRDMQAGGARPRRPRVFNPYTEFPEFSRRLIRDLENKFKLYDAGRDGFIDLMELKLMMEKLGAPQTHLGLKSMIREVDEDFDGKLSFREFLLIFHKAAAGELQEDSGLMALAKLSEINVALEGVKGAKDFFEAKVQALACASKFEAELRAEQEERKQEEEKRRLRQAAFQELKATFSA
ncbi:EF-hand domain-containing protein D1 [Erinaceus europaeus]|uniref:EF-hand domain-containing protein D1 n=1 Tax=Erinaceus europaeus TaxID=9365 RepID=A0A1S2ZJS3_ERIEU|nr:EF-hand domain-containing protein D1 [Erinaceus europaeus]